MSQVNNTPNQNANKSRSNAQPPKKGGKAGKKVRQGSLQTRAMQTTSAPVSMGSTFSGTRPRMSNHSGADVNVKHREYIGTIPFSSTPFAVQFNQPINPSNSTLFPWLSALAARYESYRFKRLAFEFRTEAPTSSPGYMMLVTDFNPDDPAPSTKAQAMQYQSVVSGPLWQNFKMQYRSEDLNKRKTYFCNNNPSSLGGQPVLIGSAANYHVGNFFVCTGGTPSGGPITAGDLFVEYEIDFMTPEINPSLPNASLNSTANSIGGNSSGTSIQPETGAQVLTSAVSGAPLSNYLTLSGLNTTLTCVRPIQLLGSFFADITGPNATISSVAGNIMTIALGNGPKGSYFGRLVGTDPVASIFSSTETKLTDAFEAQLLPGDKLDISQYTMFTSTPYTSGTYAVSGAALVIASYLNTGFGS